MGWGHHGFCCLRQALLEDVCAAWCRAEPGELEQHCLLLLQLLPALSSAGTARSSRGCCCVMHVPASVAKGGTSPLLFPSTFRFEGLDVYSRNMHCGFLISRIFFRIAQNCTEQLVRRLRSREDILCNGWYAAFLSVVSDLPLCTLLL